ncbi:unnamed protein product, partial [Closterium sp. NIES-64]
IVLSQSLHADSHPSSSSSSSSTSPSASSSSSWSGTASLALTITLTPNSLSSSLSVQNTATRTASTTSSSSSSSSSSMTQPTTRASSQPTSTPQQPSPDLLFAPSLAAHLSLSTINGARLIGCKGVRYCGSRSGRQQGRQQQETAEGGGLWGMGGLFGQLGKKKQSSGKVERSVGLQELEAAIAGTAAGGTNAAVTEANKGVSPDDKEMVGRLQGLWRDVLEGGEEGVERADYADIEAPIKRMFVDGPSSVTLLDR